MAIPEARIRLGGHADDLYLLSLLFPADALAGLHVVSAITGSKDGIFDRVSDASQTETYVTGEGVLPIIDAVGLDEIEWLAREIVLPLNGYAVLADPNLRPAIPISVSWRDQGASGSAVFGGPRGPPSPRLIAATWSPLLSELRGSRVSYMVENPLAAYAAVT